MDHVRYIAFETLQIELYRVVDYDSKWSTKFYKDCMLVTFKMAFDIYFLISVLGPMSVIAFATLQIEL